MSQTQKSRFKGSAQSDHLQCSWLSVSVNGTFSLSLTSSLTPVCKPEELGQMQPPKSSCQSEHSVVTAHCLEQKNLALFLRFRPKGIYLLYDFLFCLYWLNIPWSNCRKIIYYWKVKRNCCMVNEVVSNRETNGQGTSDLKGK